MEPNEVSELKEHAEQGGESAMRPVAFTMSVVAVLVAVTTVLGHRAETRAVLKRGDATDVWNEYQAKRNRAYDTYLATEELGTLTVVDKDRAAKDVKDWSGHQDKWAEDFNEEKKEAQGNEKEVELAENKAKFFDLAETLLEIGLVVSSVTLLTHSRIYWYLGICASIIGVASVVWGLLLR
jgi:Domain of unknown function (DUF4337)